MLETQTDPIRNDPLHKYLDLSKPFLLLIQVDLINGYYKRAKVPKWGRAAHAWSTSPHKKIHNRIGRTIFVRFSKPFLASVSNNFFAVNIAHILHPITDTPESPDLSVDAYAAISLAWTAKRK